MAIFSLRYPVVSCSNQTDPAAVYSGSEKFRIDSITSFDIQLKDFYFNSWILIAGLYKYQPSENNFD